MQDYIENGRDKMLVDPDPDEIYTKRKARFSSAVPNDHVSPVTSSVKYPSDGWGKSLERMPCFASSKCRASLNSDQFKESKNISEGRVPKAN